jgi:hydroxypyruvate isomerase
MRTATYAVNCSILFTDLPLLDRPAAAREAGFEAVEFWWPFPEPTPPDADVDAFTRAIRDAGVQLSALNFAAGDLPSGDRGILSDPKLVTAFRDNVDVAVGIAEALGTRAFNALYGNRVEGLAPAFQDDVAADNLAHAARIAGHIGATVLIEPVSGAPHYPITTTAVAARVVDRVRDQSGQDNLRVLADLYHLHVNGEDVADALATHADRIGHVQIADAPGRGEPGTGEILLARYLGILLENGYDGYIGLEYKPSRPDTFDWLPVSDRGRDGVNVESLAALVETRSQ